MGRKTIKHALFNKLDLKHDPNHIKETLMRQFNEVCEAANEANMMFDRIFVDIWINEIEEESETKIIVGGK